MSVENSSHGGGYVIQARDIHGDVVLRRGPDRPPVPDTLPTDTSVFTGREREIAAALAAAEGARGPRAVTVQAVNGMAGVGKTALAVHVAHRLTDAFPDGRLFLGLGAHVVGRPPLTPDRALLSLLLAVGTDPRAIPTGTEERAAMWRDRTSRRSLLVVLDDAVDTAQVRPLLPAGRSLVVVTSRRRLTALPGRAPITLDALSQDEGAALLAGLSGRDGADPGITRLVALCARLPLAIGVVSGQLRHRPAWDTADLAADLAAAQGELVDLRTEDVSVSTALDLSYRELPSHQRRQLRLLALHPGDGFGAHAAAALAGTDAATARTALDDLYDHHFLQETARGRYRLHDLVRSYLLRKREESDEDRSAAVARLLELYLHAAWTCERLLRGRVRPGADPDAAAPDLPRLDTVADAQAWLRDEFPAMRAGVEYAADHGLWRYAMDLPAALSAHLDLQGRWRESLDLQAVAARVADGHGTPAQRARARGDLGWARALVGDLPAAGEDLRAALDGYRALGDVSGEAEALVRTGYCQRMRGRYRQALSTLEEAGEKYRRCGDRHGAAQVLDEIGIVHMRLGDYTSSIDCHRRALAVQSEVDDRAGRAATLVNLGQSLLEVDDFDEARARFVEAVELPEELGNVAGWVRALRNVGMVQWVTCEYRGAVTTMNRVVEAHRELGDLSGQANALTHRGTARTDLGEYDLGRVDLEKAEQLYRSLGSKQGLPAVLTQLGRLREATGAFAEAADSVAQALTLYAELGTPRYEAHALAVSGSVRAALGDGPGGRTDLSRALAVFRDVGNRRGEAEALNRLGRVWFDEGDTPRARECHERALAIARGLPHPLEWALALEGVGRCLLREGDPDGARPPLREARGLLESAGSPYAHRVAALLNGSDGSDGV